MAAKRRIWDQLAASTRKRYISKGKALGQSERQVKQYYESGGNMGAYRGHKPHAGASERQWAAMVAAAKVAQLNQDGDITLILENLLAKGFKPAWITAKLNEKRESRGAYRSPINRALRRAGNKDAGREPGRSRYYKRTHPADIEIYYYH